MAKHMKRHNNPDWKHACSICPSRFRTKLSLKQHIRMGHKIHQEKWSCECGEEFNSQKMTIKNKTKCFSKVYLEHRRATCWAYPDVTVNLPYECQHCSERLLTKRGLEIHVGTLHAEHYYSCPSCGMMHAHKDYHLRHVAKCVKQSCHQCPRCKTNFVNEHNFKKHLEKENCNLARRPSLESIGNR